MKKYIYQLFVVILAISSLTLVSCNDDDEVSDINIVGTWKNTTYDADGLQSFFGQQYIRFSADGEYMEVLIGGYGAEGEVDISRGNWVLSGTDLTIGGGDFITYTAQVVESTDTRLAISVMGLRMSLIRVDDSELDVYLD